MPSPNSSVNRPSATRNGDEDAEQAHAPPDDGDNYVSEMLAAVASPISSLAHASPLQQSISSQDQQQSYQETERLSMPATLTTASAGAASRSYSQGHQNVSEAELPSCEVSTCARQTATTSSQPQDSSRPWAREVAVSSSLPGSAVVVPHPTGSIGNSSSHRSGANNDRDFSLAKQRAVLEETRQSQANHGPRALAMTAAAAAGGTATSVAGTGAQAPAQYPEALLGVPMESLHRQGLPVYVALSPDSQPRTQPTMVGVVGPAIVGSGNSSGNVNDAQPVEESREWTTGLFQCSTDIPACIDAVLCSYCLSSAHFNQLYNEQRGTYIPVCAGMFCLDCCLASNCYCVVANQFATTIFRREMRKRYFIWGKPQQQQQPREQAVSATTAGGTVGANSNGAASGGGPVEIAQRPKGGFGASVVADVLVSVFCTPCAMAQHHRELMAQGDWTGPVVFSRCETVFEVTPSVTIAT